MFDKDRYKKQILSLMYNTYSERNIDKIEFLLEALAEEARLRYEMERGYLK